MWFSTTGLLYFRYILNLTFRRIFYIEFVLIKTRFKPCLAISFKALSHTASSVSNLVRIPPQRSILPAKLKDRCNKHPQIKSVSGFGFLIWQLAKCQVRHAAGSSGDNGFFNEVSTVHMIMLFCFNIEKCFLKWKNKLNIFCKEFRNWLVLLPDIQIKLYIKEGFIVHIKWILMEAVLFRRQSPRY